MKDTSRPHPTPSRSAPYKKRKTSGPTSPARGTRRTHSASQHSGLTIPPHQALSTRRHEAHSRAISFPNDGQRRAVSKTGGSHNAPHARQRTTTDGSARQVGDFGIQADVPGPFPGPLLASAPPTKHALAGQSKDEPPPPDSVTAFLRSIRLPDKPDDAPQHQTSLSFDPPSLRHPPLSTDSANKDTCGADRGDHQVGLVYKGYPFTYDLSALPDDPKGTIALLTVTKSDPGAYLLVGAHYRRTGRSGAACAVIRSLLDSVSNPSDDQKEKDAASITSSGTSTVILHPPGFPSPTGPATDRKMSAFKVAAMRPALLLLAACELDISRGHPDDPESGSHASTARELFRSVYGIAGDAAAAGAARPQPRNALGLDFSSSPNCSFTSSSRVEPLARVKDLEGKLSAARAAHKILQEKLTASDSRLALAEDKAHALESDVQEMYAQLGASRDENRKLRQRLAESEQKARELAAQCSPTAESRVWEKLRDALFNNLGGVRGE